MALELTQRFRRHVSPYKVVQSIAVLEDSNYCPALQTILTTGLPNINREGASGCPTVIQAMISATASDLSGSIPSVASSAVTNIKWYVQRGDENKGTDIQLHSAWVGKFTIGADADKGKLFVKMNVPAGTTWKIWMECVISDQRRGTTVAIPVVTDSVLLYSIADAEDKYTMSLDRPACELYEPATDNRLVHEYLVGKGQAHTLTDDGNTHLRAVTATLRQAAVPLSLSAYAVKVYSMSASGVRTEVTAATDDCVSSISANVVTFDLRFAKSKSYQIACVVGSAEVCHKTYGWVWSSEKPNTNEGIIGANTYTNNAAETYRTKLNLGKRMLAYPEVGFNLSWYWRRLDTLTLNYVGAGERMTYNLSTPNMFTNGEAEVALTIDRRGAFCHITDGTGRYVDENGDYLIEN